MEELRLEMMPAYSPQARGRGERTFQTWQERLPPQLRLPGIRTLEQANAFLRQSYLQECKRKFTGKAAPPGRALVRTGRTDLPQGFSIQPARVVHRHNTVNGANPCRQSDKTSC